MSKIYRPGVPQPWRDINYIFVHWTASGFGDAETIDKWHKERGWRGIGYHKVILNGYRDPAAEYDERIDGLIEQGREDWMQPAATKGHNKDSLAVVVVGDIPEDLSFFQGLALAQVLRDWMDKYNVPPSRVLGHREVADTECPGVDPELLRRILRYGTEEGAK